MTKATRRILSLCMAIAMCATFALTASASSVSSSAGVYVVLEGEVTQDTIMPHTLHTTTSVVRNPNGSYLKTEMECYSGSLYTLSDESVSEAGETDFTHDFTIWVESYETRPDLACANHYVIDPDTSEILYDVYTSVTLSWDTTGLSTN